MENRELDHLFKTGLEKTAAYSTAEEQWEVVAARLAQPTRRKPVWWWFLGAGIGVVLLCLLFLPKNVGSQPAIGAFKIPIATTRSGATLAPEVRSDVAEGTIELIEPARKLQPSATSLPVAPITAPQAGAKTRRDVQYKQVGAALVAEDEEVESSPSSTGVDRKEMPVFSVLEARKALVVRNIALLPFEELTSITEKSTPVLMEVHYEQPLQVEVASASRWILGLGIQRDFINSGKVMVDYPNLPYYGMIAMNFLSHWQASLEYGVGNAERTIMGDPRTYRVPIIDAPQEGDLPTATQLRYRNQSLDVQVAYHLPQLKKIGLSLNTGLQWNKDSKIDAVYDYEGIYQPVTVIAVLPDTKLALSDFTLGADLSYPLTNTYRLHGGFQQYFSLDRSGTFRWPLRRRVQLGLSYQF